MVSIFDFQRRRRKILDEEQIPDQDTMQPNQGPPASTSPPPPLQPLPQLSSGSTVGPGGPRLVKPTLAAACSTHAITNKDSRTLELCREAGERVKISVGTGPHRRVFLIHKALLRCYSDYFRAELRGGSKTPSSGPDVAAVVIVEDGEFDLPEVDVDVFSRFVRWLYSCRTCKKGGDRLYEADHRCRPQSRAADQQLPWCGVPLEHDYALGEWLLSSRYCSFVFAHFVPHVNADSLGLDRVRWILDDTAADAPMHRFARHWLCWLKLCPPDEKRAAADWARFPDLDGLDAGWAVTDPRAYRLEHWEAECSVPGTTASTTCPHIVADQLPRTDSGDVSSKMGRALGPSPTQRLWDKYRDPLRASFGLLVLIYHFIFPFAWVGISAFIIVADDDPLLFEASKYYSLITGCLAVIGIWPICMRLMKMYFAVACSLLVIIASVLSFASSSTCLAGADRDVERSICKMEIGVGVLQFFYAIIVATSYKW